MGQNQCQECGNWGHNRRGCPSIKESHARVEAMAKKYGIKLPGRDEYVSTNWITDINNANMAANGNVTKTEDEITYAERWRWEELEGRKRAQARKNGRGRTCGFCGLGGHNSRTCPDKKQHRKDCNAMQGLAHRVVAACLEKAGIVPGALMRYRDWDYKTNDYAQTFCIVTEIDWSGVADPGYDCDQGMPSRFEQWFKAPLITIRRPNGDTGKLRLPRDVKQQSNYNYYENPSEQYGLASPVLNGTVNKSNGWMGDNITLLSPDVGGIYRSDTATGITDQDLNPVVEKLITDVGAKWSNY
jgi:hypothetical protein